VPDTHSDQSNDVGPYAGGAATPPRASIREPRAIPAWDWILLPLIGVITIAILGGCARLIADREAPHSKQVVGTCIQQSGAGPRHGVPNSVCIERSPAGQPVQYRFNACGDRTPFDCRQKPEGVYRIVLIGSSIPMGWDVQEPDSLAERLLADISQSTHRRVEVYNSAMEGSGGSPEALANRMPRTMALHPDLMLWVISSWDIDPDNIKAQDKAPQSGLAESRILGRVFGKFRIASFLTEFLYRSQSVYMTAYLRNVGEAAQLKENSNQQEEGRMRFFNSDVKTIVDGARAAGVPVVATFLPNRAESDLFAMSPRPAGIDPDRLNNDVRNVMVGNGAIFVDALTDLKKTPNLDGLYDQRGFHLNARGHAVLTQIVAQTLTGGAIPELSVHNQVQAEKAQ
jgi:hypothetical protein